MLTDAVVGDLAAFGPFFAVQTHHRGSIPPDPWHAMNELVDNPDVLMDRVAGVRSRLATAGGQAPDGVELRVAASVTYLGLVARLVSPALAAAVTSGELLQVDLDSTRWQPVLGGAFPLSVQRGADADASGHDVSPECLAGLLARRVLDGPVRDLLEVTRALSVSPQVLWGNVASALNGAASMITASQPAWTDRARVITSLLLDQPPLRDTATASADGRFRRRSCCLIYRAAPNAAGVVCGDCVLSSDPPL
ncbi:MAG TPA: (2Fe-2S)-binding protein [Pseudonocardiaceae bacterium]|nr:(2Fe-2S)-binding protein [Pseudonocardiaceae bacterium]